MRKFLVAVLAIVVSGCAALQAVIEPPQVTLNNLQVLDMTLLEQRYAVTLRVQNPNPVPLPVTGMNFQIDINDTELGRGVSNRAVTVPAYGEALVEISLVEQPAACFQPDPGAGEQQDPEPALSPVGRAQPVGPDEQASIRLSRRVQPAPLSRDQLPADGVCSRDLTAFPSSPT